MTRRWFAILASGLVVGGCLSGPHAYLRLASRYEVPAEFDGIAPYEGTVDAWTRHASLGLEGGIAAVLEDAAVGAAFIADQASRSRTPGRPGLQAADSWDDLYHKGYHIPVRVRWRFNKHFHKETSIDPKDVWTFKLVDDKGLILSPVEFGKLTTLPSAKEWIGEFRVWFTRKTIDGHTQITQGTRRLTLQVSGRPGDAELVWRFQPLLEAHDEPFLLD